MFLVYLFLDFFLKTLTFSPLNCSTTLNSILDPATVGTPTLVELPSASETNNASTENTSLTSLSCLFTSIISPVLTVN
ncbi:MAG: hypothetical protein Q8S84_07595 [bacterium]|nr:hypothetical protein [bacterium]MDP3381309.1 hypothetical protein [bacterium]